MGAAFVWHGTANSDSVDGANSTPVPRFLAVPSTTKYVNLGTPILAVQRQLLRKCKHSAVPCRGKNQCATPVLGPVPIFKPEKKWHRAEKKWHCSKRKSCRASQNVNSVNGALSTICNMIGYERYNTLGHRLVSLYLIKHSCSFIKQYFKHSLISKYRSLRLSYFPQPACLYLEIRGKTLNRDLFRSI